MKSANDVKKYVETCREAFWQKVFRVETDYLTARLENCRDILSVGCGPATIEGELIRKGFRLTGLDVSAEALACAPDGLRTVVGRAEDMPFPDHSFDAVIFVVSLQFIADYRSAFARTSAVLRPDGKMIAMLLNPESAFFRTMRQDPSSYVQWIRHTDLDDLEKEAGRHFNLRSEYFLGIRGENIFESQNPAQAALKVLTGRKAPQKMKAGGAS
ncbi:MAG: class I SAM-dependent methyltransferase [Smithellaceae bacterium]|jgi:SAM-dependent methyltransferase|nr:class I SAM-dependent methyltransferase [Smithellaceae bacterium]